MAQVGEWWVVARGATSHAVPISLGSLCLTLCSLHSQAQARCHRIGQSKAVKVYRLITRNSYEREMFDKASLKLGLDKAVLQDINRKGSTNGVGSLSEWDLEEGRCCERALLLPLQVTARSEQRPGQASGEGELSPTHSHRCCLAWQAVPALPQGCGTHVGAVSG